MGGPFFCFFDFFATKNVENLGSQPSRGVGSTPEGSIERIKIKAFLTLFCSGSEPLCSGSPARNCVLLLSRVANFWNCTKNYKNIRNWLQQQDGGGGGARFARPNSVFPSLCSFWYNSKTLRLTQKTNPRTRDRSVGRWHRQLHR